MCTGSPPCRSHNWTVRTSRLKKFAISFHDSKRTRLSPAADNEVPPSRRSFSELLFENANSKLRSEESETTRLRIVRTPITGRDEETSELQDTCGPLCSANVRAIPWAHSCAGSPVDNLLPHRPALH